jgi:hypothetical protein
VSRFSDRLLRLLLGVDPDTFRPYYRVQKLLLDRGVRVVQARKGMFAKRSAFLLLGFYALVYGVMAAVLVATSKSALLGAAIAYVLGCSFLLLVVVADNFDLLVNPREALILAAHPHDDRTFLFAKLAAIGRSLSILALLLFTPSGIAAGFSAGSPLAAAGFYAGAVGAVGATVSFGLLLAAALLKAGGKGAVERMLPWIQGAFQIGYFLVIGGQRLTATLVASGLGELGPLPWILPPFWFIAPLELVIEGPSGPALGRLALAVSALGLLLFVGVRWLGSGLTERLLEPTERRTAAPARTGAKRLRKRSSVGSSERARLFALLRVQLRSDWRTRSEFLLMPVMGAFLLLFYSPGGGAAHPGPVMSSYFYSLFLLMSADALTRSSRPESLWWILSAPIDRGRFSIASLGLVRAFQLAPLFAAAVLAQFLAHTPGPLLLATAAELLAMGDLLILVGKGFYPDFPFSRPRGGAGLSGERTARALVCATVCGICSGLLYLASLWGARGVLAGAGVFFLLRFPVAFWTRRRVIRAAEDLELGTAAAD